MNTTSAHILIVEDDRDIRETLAELLEEEGFQTVVAANGKEALDRIRSEALPCVVLLDLMMPVMDGWAFRARLDLDPELAAIPVIVLSADSEVADKAVALRASAHLAKPVAFDRLLEMVHRFCPHVAG